MSDDPVTIIESPKFLGSLNLRDVVAYRELLFYLAWRDVQVRYKQTLIGVGWAIIRPMMTMIVFAIVFGTIVDVPSDNVEYPVFAYAALVPWTLFSVGLSKSADSLVNNANLIKNVYFPRILIPLASILSGIVDFLSAFGVLIIIMLVYGIIPSLTILWVLPLTALTIFAALGVGLGLAALNVRYRDIRFVVPFMIQLLIYITPIAWPTSLIRDEWWYPLVGLNPMAGVVEGFRWALYGHTVGLNAPWFLLSISTGVTALSVAIGLVYFAHQEPSFADIV